MSMLLPICHDSGCRPYLYALINVIEALAMHVLLTPRKSVGLARGDFHSLNQNHYKCCAEAGQRVCSFQHAAIRPALMNLMRHPTGVPKTRRKFWKVIMKIRAALLFLLCVLAADACAHPQELPKRDRKARPTLGLVLEGGGALGLAHIGIITWMEEHHIPVNYVAGTSMGGLVGGIYATGRTPAEVRELINGIDWDQVLSGVTPFRDLSYRRKQDAHEVPGQLEFGLRGGLQFPSGFNTGQEVNLVLDKVALPYSEIPSFNDLPIPFACVATDLVSGKRHVFRDGSLSLAMRSTMSLPGIFTPVRSGKSLYADGFLLDNLPIDVGKEMGADIVLGIHLETAPLDPSTPCQALAYWVKPSPSCLMPMSCVPWSKRTYLS